MKQTEFEEGAPQRLGLVGLARIAHRNSQLRSPFDFRSISEGFYVKLKVAKYVMKET